MLFLDLTERKKGTPQKSPYYFAIEIGRIFKRKIDFLNGHLSVQHEARDGVEDSQAGGQGGGVVEQQLQRRGKSEAEEVRRPVVRVL